MSNIEVTSGLDLVETRDGLAPVALKVQMVFNQRMNFTVRWVSRSEACWMGRVSVWFEVGDSGALAERVLALRLNSARLITPLLYALHLHQQQRHPSGPDLGGVPCLGGGRGSTARPH